MFNLPFLVLMVTTFYYAMHGKYKERLCGITVIVGIATGLFGVVVTLTTVPAGNSFLPSVLYLMVAVFSALLLKKMAMRFVTLYEDKQREETERFLKSVKRRDSAEDKPYYTDDNFDDPELRFGKGGYTDNDL